ncbi:hypothetical protein LINGRAHAP2_LOCUS27913 [Linum grandiflorum]
MFSKIGNNYSSLISMAVQEKLFCGKL